MNMTRVFILVGALVAAALAAFLARGLMGGQNQAAAAPNMELTEIVVAAKPIEVGAKIMPGDLKWQGWPKTAIDATFITKESQPQALEDSAEGSVARMPRRLRPKGERTSRRAARNRTNATTRT